MENVSKEELKKARRKVAKQCQYLDKCRTRYWESYRGTKDYRLLIDVDVMDVQYDDMEFVLMILDEIIAEE